MAYQSRSAEVVAGLDHDWQELAVCRPERGHDPAMWFSEDGRKLIDQWMTVEAKRICDQECPVAEACLDFALDARIEHGIWGGTDPEERAKIRRRQSQPSQMAAVG